MEYRWIETSPGRQRRVRVREALPDNRSSIPCPNLIRDFDEPVRSCANGEYYTSKRALAATHRASGNPHGQDFIELGNEEMPWVEHKADPVELRNDLREAMRDVLTGNIPPEIAAIQ